MDERTATHLVGDRAECAFMTEVMSRGFRAARPYSAVSPYDVIVDSGTGRLWRVQVRSVGTLRRTKMTLRHFRVGLQQGSGRRSITRKDNDFLAVLLALCGIWYLIPVNVIAGRTAIVLLPDTPGSKYDRFREAWHLLARSRLPSLPAAGFRRNRLSIHKSRTPAELRYHRKKKIWRNFKSRAG